jgi:hypothetical protein
MNYLVNPQDLVFKAKSRIQGLIEMITEEEVPQWDLLETSLEIVEEWSSDWDDGHGFGSSDGTYLLKDFIDTVIGNYTNGKYKTDFTPSLSVIKLS